MYFANRTQCISIAENIYPEVGILFGIPQGTILEPKNNCMYTKPVGEIFPRHNIKYHCYPDDTQIYTTLKTCHKWDDISSSIEVRIEDITIWMNSNMLKFNRYKIELIVLPSKQHVKKTDNIKVQSDYINSSIFVRNLGLLLDNILELEKQVNYICKTCHYQIRNIAPVGNWINDETSNLLLFLDLTVAMLCYYYISVNAISHFDR